MRGRKVLGESATFQPDRSGGIKPLTAPRVAYVRTDSAGNPVAVQVPPAIRSPRGRRSAYPPSPRGRELEGGLVRRRARPSAALTHKARDLRRNTTPTENLLWKHLRKTQVPKYKFTRQYPIGPYIADFCCTRARLVVELDGGQHATQQEFDTDRQRYLEAQDYRVIRFWNNEVLENLEGVLFRIVEALEEARGLASDARDPHANPLRLAPGVRGALGRAGSSAGHARAREREPAFDGWWVRVVEIEDLWKVNDEWWRGPEEGIARLYYTVRLENSQHLTVYLGLIANSWYRQAG